MTLNASDANLARIAYQRALTFGELNSPFDARVARITSSDFAANKQTVVSDELRADRMVGDLIETAFTSGGSFGFELSLGGEMDNLFESLLAGTAAAAIAFVGDLQVVAATQTLSDPGAAGTAFTNAVAGQYVLLAGFTTAGNNGWHRIASVTSGDAVVLATDVADLADETTASGQAKATSTIIRNPGDPTQIVKRDYNIEQYFSDIDVAMLFLGQRLGVMDLNVAANAIVGGTLTFQGTSVQVQEGSGSYADSIIPPGVAPVVSATANVARVEITGDPVPCEAQSLSVNIDNALRNQNAIGSKYPCGIGYGRQTITGGLVLYFQDLAVYNQFLAHSDASLVFGFTDALGNGLHFYLPRVKFATDTPAPEGIDTDVTEDIEWTAIAYDPGDGQDPYQIQVSIATPA